jgi:hypothetical protein
MQIFNEEETVEKERSGAKQFFFAGKETERRTNQWMQSRTSDQLKLMETV